MESMQTGMASLSIIAQKNSGDGSSLAHGFARAQALTQIEVDS